MRCTMPPICASEALAAYVSSSRAITCSMACCSWSDPSAMVPPADRAPISRIPACMSTGVCTRVPHRLVSRHRAAIIQLNRGDDDGAEKQGTFPPALHCTGGNELRALRQLLLHGLPLRAKPVGTAVLPVWLAWYPKLVLPPAAMAAL